MSMFWETRWPIPNSGCHGNNNTHFLASDLHNVTVVRTAYLADRILRRLKHPNFREIV